MNSRDVSEKSRRVFTAREKLLIVEEAKSLGFNKTMKKYSIQATQITKWRKNAEDLRTMLSIKHTASRVVKKSHEIGAYPEIEAWVYNKYREFICSNNRITRKQFQKWAKEAAQLPEIQRLYGEAVTSCRFGTSWVNGFKKLYNIPMNAHTGKESSISHDMKQKHMLSSHHHRDSMSHSISDSHSSYHPSSSSSSNAYRSPTHHFSSSSAYHPSSPSSSSPADSPLSSTPSSPMSVPRHTTTFHADHIVPTGVVVGAMGSTAATSSMYHKPYTSQYSISSQPMHTESDALAMASNLSGALWDHLDSSDYLPSNVIRQQETIDEDMFGLSYGHIDDSHIHGSSTSSWPYDKQ